MKGGKRGKPVNRRSLPYVPLDVERILNTSVGRTESGPSGGSYTVRKIRAGNKDYRCPGCLQIITRGQPHVVVWPQEHIFGNSAGLDERRHWHNNCWKRRLRPS